jgi:hypothetical protein
MILYRLRVAQYESKYVAATRSLIKACLFIDLFVYLTQRAESHQVDISVHRMTCLWLEYQGLVCCWTRRGLSMAGRSGTCRRPFDQGLV